MDTFELAKIAGAVLSALLVIVGFRTMLEIVEESRPQEKPGFTLPLPAEQTPAAQPGAGAAVPAPVALPAFEPAAVVKASADGNAQNGATTFKKCQACHDGTRGGPNKVGPNLWGIVGRPKAAHEGFNYSDALSRRAAIGRRRTSSPSCTPPRPSLQARKCFFPASRTPPTLPICSPI